jgi:tripartite ATP-independent transporter DctM subunit
MTVPPPAAFGSNHEDVAMPWYLAAGMIVGGMLAAMAVGIPVAFSFALAGMVGLILVEGANALRVIPQIVHDTGTDFVLVTVPLFIFMAEVLAVGGFTRKLYRSFDRLVGRVPGETGLATMASCAAFAAVCGSSYVTVATIGRMALPELLQRKYDNGLSAGIVAAGGTLGILIPPSLTFIMYGLLTDTSIGQLFFAGVIPGLLLLTFFCITIIAKVKMTGMQKVHVPSTFGEKVEAVVDILPIIAVAFLVLSSIYFGFATPTESAAIGSALAVAAGLIYRTLRIREFAQALRQTIYTTGFIILLLITAKILAFLYAIMGVGEELAGLARTVDQPYVVLAIALGILLVLGMIMDGMAMLVLAVPVIVPVLVAVGFHPIWFGVIFVVFTELGLLTPPVGVNCYMVAQFGREYGITVKDAFSGILPFCFCMLLVVLALILFPQIALWLPSTMVAQ